MGSERVLVFLLLLGLIDCHTFDDVDRLIKHLFNETRYNRRIRPALNQSQATQVNISHQISSIEEVNIGQGYIVTVNLLQVTWYDDFLAWSSSEFGGMSKLTLPRDFFWKPELALTSGSSNDDVLIGELFSPAFLEISGLVTMFPVGYFKTKCETNTQFWPFDSHVCSFQITCSNYDSDEVLLQSLYTTIDMSLYTNNNEWTVERTESSSLVFSDASAPMRLSFIRNSLTINRRPMFEIVHSCIPVILVFSLSVVTSMVPVDSGERLSFSVTVFLSYVFMSTATVAFLPRDSTRLTMISLLMIFGSIVTTIGVLWSVLIVRISKITTEQHKIPKILSKMTSYTMYKKHTQKPTLAKRKLRNVKVFNIEDDVEKVNDHEGGNEQDIINNAETEQPIQQHDNDNCSWTDVCKMLDLVYFVSVLVITGVMYVAVLGRLAYNKVL